MKKTVAITPTEYGALQVAFDHFNGALFGGRLPDVLITYQRCAHSSGYFSPDRFSGRVDDTGNHELALNPDCFIGHTDKEVCQTLTHEMAHLGQHVFGKPSAHGYHNKEWAEGMKSIGLMPSSTGMLGGKETGQKMLDYVIPGGPFERAYDDLAAKGWRLSLQSAPQSGPSKPSAGSKIKFTCPACGTNAWGKATLDIECRPCRTPMVPEPA